MARSALVCGSSQRTFVVRCNKHRTHVNTRRTAMVRPGAEGDRWDGSSQASIAPPSRRRSWSSTRRPVSRSRAGARRTRSGAPVAPARATRSAGGWRSGMPWRRPDVPPTSWPSASAPSSTDWWSWMRPAHRCGTRCSGTTPVRVPRPRGWCRCSGRRRGRSEWARCRSPPSRSRAGRGCARWNQVSRPPPGPSGCPMTT